MARNVRMTLEEAAKHRGQTDRAKVLATTDEDIDRQCDDDEDLVRDVTELGRPLPDAKAIRMKLGLGQDAFAAAIGVPVGTLRNWEQRRSIPDPAGVSLLRVVAREPDAVFKALGVKVAVRKAKSAKRAAA